MTMCDRRDEVFPQTNVPLHRYGVIRVDRSVGANPIRISCYCLSRLSVPRRSTKEAIRCPDFSLND